MIRYPEIENTPVWVLPNIWRLGRLRNTKFGTKVSNKMLRNAAKFKAYSFYRFLSYYGKTNRWWGRGKITHSPLPTQIKPLGPCKSKPLKKLKSSRLHMFFKIGSNRKTPVLGSLFNKIAGLKVCNFLKIDSNTGFSCGYCKICKNSFLVQNLRWLLLTVLPVAASDNPTTVQ